MYNWVAKTWRKGRIMIESKTIETSLCSQMKNLPRKTSRHVKRNNRINPSNMYAIKERGHFLMNWIESVIDLFMPRSSKTIICGAKIKGSHKQARIKWVSVLGTVK